MHSRSGFVEGTASSILSSSPVDLAPYVRLRSMQQNPLSWESTADRIVHPGQPPHRHVDIPPIARSRDSRQVNSRRSGANINVKDPLKYVSGTLKAYYQSFCESIILGFILVEICRLWTARKAGVFLLVREGATYPPNSLAKPARIPAVSYRLIRVHWLVR